MLDVIKPTEREKAARCLVYVNSTPIPRVIPIFQTCFRLQYNCVENYYKRPNNGGETVPGWEKLATSAVGIFRKDERPDHNKCYLSRVGGDVGYISWKIDLSGLSVKRMEIDLGQLTTFVSGQIVATAFYGATGKRITIIASPTNPSR
jgi:hypothetical protein